MVHEVAFQGQKQASTPLYDKITQNSDLDFYSAKAQALTHNQNIQCFLTISTSFPSSTQLTNSIQEAYSSQSTDQHTYPRSTTPRPCANSPFSVA
jgi:hypothetical protein